VVGARWRRRARVCHDAPVPISDRLLMGPGPSNPYPEVAQALAGPVLGHLDPDFLAILDSTNERLRHVFATTNPLTLPVSGTGSAGMEASFVNFVRAGDPVVVGVNGVFGERMCDVADRLGAAVVRVDAPWGTPIEPAALLSAHPDPSIIAVVHAETSTGVRNYIQPLGANKGNALLLVDMVTSLGGIEVAVDDWGVDIAYSGTQKCLGVPPGLSPLTVSPRAQDRMVERPSSWYLDLNLLSRYVHGGAAGGRVYHHTAPVTMIAALHAGLGAVLDEGVDAARRRHAECGELLQSGLEAMGLTLFAQEGSRLPQLTTVEIPPDLPGEMGEADVRRILLNRYGIEIGAGAGQLAGKVWRIGCMGHTARRRNVLALLGALREVLDR
jgi:alanine-glyoxylate transaminase/serine-glyoxylate transaminase/serine-pyruvate transaminase